MNKIFSIALLFAAAFSFSACVNEEDDLFDKSAAERLNEASELYSQRLTASPNGWAVQLYPTKQDKTPYGNGYLLMFRFHSNKSVDASMNNALSNNKYISDSSTWDVITDNGPVLSFNTYNKVVHAFSNPEDVPSTGTQDEPNDETGTGIGGDYEFIIVDAPEDASYMMLKGKKRGTYNLLTPVAEGIDYKDYLSDVNTFQNNIFSSSDLYSDTLHVGDTKLKFDGANDGMPSIYPWNEDKVINETFNPFLITKRGSDYYLRFRDSKTYGDLTFQELKFNQEKDVFESEENPAIYLEGANPAYILDSLFVKSSSKWVVNNESEMGGSFKTIYDDVKNQFYAQKKATLVSLSIMSTSAGPVLRLAYRIKKNASVDYLFSANNEADGESFTYKGASKDGAALLKTFPIIQNLLDYFGQKFLTSAATTRFNLSKIKMTSSSDSESWFVVSLN